MDKQLKNLLDRASKGAKTNLIANVSNIVFEIRSKVTALREHFKGLGQDFSFDVIINEADKFIVDGEGRGVYVFGHDSDYKFEDFETKSMVILADTADNTGDIAASFIKLSTSKHGRTVDQRRYCVDEEKSKATNTNALMWELTHGLKRYNITNLSEDLIAFLVEDILPEGKEDG